MARPRARLSLKGRALQLLAQRDQSRVELRRKLRRHAAIATAAVSERDEGVDDRESDETSREAEHADVEVLLDWLESNRYLSAERFVESRVHAREGRFGNLRIKSELARHAVTLTPEMRCLLAASELERARLVRSQRFSAPPSSAVERAKQARFLAGRGFSSEVVHVLLKELRRAPHVVSSDAPFREESSAD